MNRSLQHLWLLVLLPILALSGCGGADSGADVQHNAPSGTGDEVTYSGPPPASADVAAFQLHLWSNLISTNRCGACHGAGGQAPTFARSDDVNLAYAAANTVVTLYAPGNSTVVSKVGGGHNCWLGTDGGSLSACGSTLTTWIDNWANANVSSEAAAIEFFPPPERQPGETRAFPASSSLFGTHVWPIFRNFCVDCHQPDSSTPITPYFAHGNVDEAYLAAQSVLNLDSPASSRVVQRLKEDSHNCWSDSCQADGDALAAAIQAMANGIALTPPDPSLVISRALRLEDGIPVAGGGRYESNQIALYEFRTGSGSTVYDTSGIEPAINLTLTGDTEWVGGWGVRFNGGKAQGSTAASSKLASMIRATAAFSIEAWVVPATSTQDMGTVVSYSAGETNRNVTLYHQNDYYQAAVRHENTDGNGMPALDSPDASVQATLQHVVITYDVINGRRIYINGEDTGVIDATTPDLLNSWNQNYALVLGNEASSSRPWRGVLRFAAIHNRALSEAQIQQNFDAGVGERFYMLFGIGHLIGVADSYIGFTASRFDDYGYLFAEPFFINLNEAITLPPEFDLRGMRLGINGTESTTAQVWSRLDTVFGGTGYTQTGQPLSRLGTVLGLQYGPTQDEFFLTFEQLASNSHVFTEPGAAPLVIATATAQSDIGLRTFDEINATMSALTGVDRTSTQVANTFALVRQQLPADPNAAGFLTAQQIGIAQLAIAYCDAMVDSEADSSTYFPGLNYATNANSISDGNWRSLVIDVLTDRMVGPNLESQPDPDDVGDELASLLLSASDVKPVGSPDGQPDGLARCNGSCPADQTRIAVKAACTAALGSATMLMQ